METITITMETITIVQGSCYECLWNVFVFAGVTFGRPENATVPPDRIPPVITILGTGSRAILATGEAVLYDTVMFRCVCALPCIYTCFVCVIMT